MARRLGHGPDSRAVAGCVLGTSVRAAAAAGTVPRPLVPTGTNLLGIVKHVASVEAGYVGATFGRPFGEP